MTILRISPPDIGQPIDVPYLYDMAVAINNLADQIDDSSDRSTTIYSREELGRDLRTSDAKFYANFVDVVSGVTKSAGDTESFSFNISEKGFRYAPIVTATAVNTGSSTSSNDVTVVLQSVTNSAINGFVRFNSPGRVDVAVNVIAIGISS
jgi:hypothetical protein